MITQQIAIQNVSIIIIGINKTNTHVLKTIIVLKIIQNQYKIKVNVLKIVQMIMNQNLNLTTHVIQSAQMEQAIAMEATFALRKLTFKLTREQNKW